MKPSLQYSFRCYCYPLGYYHAYHQELLYAKYIQLALISPTFFSSICSFLLLLCNSLEHIVDILELLSISVRISSQYVPFERIGIGDLVATCNSAASQNWQVITRSSLGRLNKDY